MKPQTSLSRPITADEKEALSHYGADSTYLHAAAQSRGADFANDPEWARFWPRCSSLFKQIDAAISVSILQYSSTLYSGHGNGFAVRGALEGDPASFVGMTYRYPGYISTSSDRDWCDAFLEKRRNSTSRPVMMTLILPADFEAIDMVHGGHHGEFEFLLGRNLQFSIQDASLVDGDVLSLVLKPR